MRVVIELKRDAQPAGSIKSAIQAYTDAGNVWCYMLALVNGAPKVLTLQETMMHFLDHRMEVLIRRTKYELMLQKNAHIFLKVYNCS
jgi:DNA gyrase subunit A